MKPRFEVYKAVSRQIRAIFARVHAAGRAAVARRGLSRRHDQPQGHAAAAATIAREIRARILEETGLTASAGHLLQQVPGQARLGPAQAQRPVRHPAARRARPSSRRLPVGKFHGVGPATAAKMKRLGIHTGADLSAQTLDFLRAVFRQGAAPGITPSRAASDERPVVPDRPRKSVGSETTFMRGPRPRRPRSRTACALGAGRGLELVRAHTASPGGP